MKPRPIRTADRSLNVDVRASPSKSVTHRALVAAALARGTSTVRGPLQADDTRRTLDGLAGLGVVIRAQRERWIVQGCDGAVTGGGKLLLGESGTSLRLLLAVAALGGSPSSLDGEARLRQRPLDELVRALADLGASIRPGPGNGRWPLTAGGAPLRGGEVRLAAGRSSQFASALLLIGPHLPGGLDLILEPPVVSLPYVELTAGILSDFGARIERPTALHWKVRAGSYAGRELHVEGDHSSASYFLSAAAVVGGRVRVRRLDPLSRQPDARLGRILAGLGCRVELGADWIEVRGGGRLQPFDIDLLEAPDLAPTLAVLGLFAAIATRLP